MKKKLFVFSIIVCIVLTACAAKNEKQDTKYDEKKAFNEDVILNRHIAFFIKSDGTVWGKGENQYGQLGAGFVSHKIEDWTQVVGLNNIVKICASSSYGSNDFEYRGLHCYALDSEGNLYKWGGGIEAPILVDIFDQVEDIYRPFDGMMTVLTKGKNKFLMTEYGPSNGTAEEDHDVFYVFSLGKRQELSDVFFYSTEGVNDYIALVDGKIYTMIETGITDSNDGMYISEESFDSMFSLQEIITDEKMYRCGQSGVNEKYFFGKDSGKIYSYNISDGFNLVSEGGGNNVQKCLIALEYDFQYGELSTTAYLYNDGRVGLVGSNAYGQIGNGSNTDVDDINILENTKFVDICGNPCYYVSAIDNDGNVWAWGDGFSNSPEIVIAVDDYGNEKK